MTEKIFCYMRMTSSASIFFMEHIPTNMSCQEQDGDGVGISRFHEKVHSASAQNQQMDDESNGLLRSRSQLSVDYCKLLITRFSKFKLEKLSNDD